MSVAASSRARFGDVVKAYVALTKPRIIELLLITTVPAMFLAAGGIPPWRLIAWTMLGGLFAAASANILDAAVLPRPPELFGQKGRQGAPDKVARAAGRK